MALPHIGCVLVIGFAASVVNRDAARKIPAVGAAFIIGTCSWFFVSTGWLSYFDSWYILALLIVAFSYSRPAIVITSLLAPWIQERFLLGLPLAVLCRALYFGIEGADARRQVYIDAAYAGLAITPYLAIRLGAVLLQLDPRTGGYIADLSLLLDVSLVVRLWGAWNGLRAGWVFVIIFLILGAAGATRLWKAALITAMLATLLISSYISADLSRTASLFVTAALGGIVLLLRATPAKAATTIASIAVLNLLLPAFHVVSTYQYPARSIFAEVQRYRDPPPFLDPDHYFRRGNEWARQENYLAAQTEFNYAIQLKRDFVLAYLNRGVVSIALGQTESARGDLATVMRLSRDNSAIQREARRLHAIAAAPE